MTAVKTLRVARIPYLNTEPFLADGRLEGFSLISASPRELGRLAAEGKLDAGPLSLVDFWKLEDLFEPVADLGIASKSAARSVRVFSKRPLAELAGAQVGVTDQTSTSVRLLQILLASRYGIEAKFKTGFGASDDARLVIGDDALMLAKKGLAGYPVAADLGQEWRDWRKLPFVFARWAVRKAAPAYLKEELADRLSAALRRHEKDPATLRRLGAAKGLSAAETDDYFKGLTFRLGENERKAEEAFRDLVTGKVPGCGC